MKFKDLHPPILELAPGQTFHRVQLTRARKTSVRINGLLLAPTGLQSGRFCLTSEATAYLADSEHTALYESIFRRDVHCRSLDELARKSLVTFITKGPLRLADVRALAEPYPVLQAQRIAITQAFAQECRGQQLDGIVYASAQHPQHACIALFATGMAQMKKVGSLPLVKPGTRQVLTCVTDAARRSGVPLMNFADSQ
jgi:hypothetical protein